MIKILHVDIFLYFIYIQNIVKLICALILIIGLKFKLICIMYGSLVHMYQFCNGKIYCVMKYIYWHHLSCLNNHYNVCLFQEALFRSFGKIITVKECYMEHTKNISRCFAILDVVQSLLRSRLWSKIRYVRENKA